MVPPLSMPGPVAPLAYDRAVVLSSQLLFLFALLRAHAGLVALRPVA